MKKLLFFASLLALVLGACSEKKAPQPVVDTAQTDSLSKIIEQKDNELNDMMGTLNEIQEGFREINEAENRVTIAKDGERADKLRQSTIKGDQFKETIDNLTKQLQEKDQQLQQLRAELDAKDIHISALDETINNLNSDVSNLKTESAQKSQTISTQDHLLNTAWYVFGTKRELRNQHILEGSKVMNGNFNKNYFTKIDIRDTREIKLYSKSAQIRTVHPSGSYTLERDANKQYVLRITNPQNFWSTSKYLVIVVK